jgi:UDP-N-acetylmuramyl pentapeptide phosphotransferase/UDP-N-acetylglucosamine-1-phosphate transferase
LSVLVFNSVKAAQLLHEFGTNATLKLVALTALSSATCALLIALLLCAPRLGRHGIHLKAVQAAHRRPTPRLGGLAIFAAFGASYFLVPVAVADVYGRFVAACAILFTVGLMEDLGFGISPRTRLLAAAIASLTAIWLLGVWLPRSDIPWLDDLMPHWAIGVPITLLVTAGMANGFNLIDGVNGLAALTALAAAVALGLIAHQAGYTLMADLTTMLAAGIFGFLLLNYPFGLIFLGDAGAYTLGFVLSWFGIAVLIRVPDASPWAILLTMFWPVADTLLAIYRRSRRNAPRMAPDRLHVHQMVMRTLEICILGRDKRSIANPLSTIVLAPFVIAPPVAGVLLWNQPGASAMAVLVFSFLFFSSYVAMPMIIRRFRR